MDAAYLQSHFIALDLPPEAQEYLLDLWQVIQFLDDAQDGDAIAPARVNAAAWAIFARMPLNSFYRNCMTTLQPLLAMQLIKWEAANAAEALGKADARSYMWRAGYYEIVAMACHLCGKDAREGLALYGETFAQYREEFQCQGL
ncbi:MAG: hypothetical protein V4657_02900 [Pseudomonadota bacterium]